VEVRGRRRGKQKGKTKRVNQFLETAIHTADFGV